MKRTADYTITCNVDFSFPESASLEVIYIQPLFSAATARQAAETASRVKIYSAFASKTLRPAEGTDLHSTHGHWDGVETRGQTTKHAWGQNNATYILVSEVRTQLPNLCNIISAVQQFVVNTTGSTAQQ